MRIDRDSGRRCAGVLVRVLPAQDRCRRGKPVRGARASCSGLEPSFVSVTYGAGGSTREKTIEIVKRIREQYGLEAMAHFTCVGATVERAARDARRDARARGSTTCSRCAATRPRARRTGRKTEGGLEYSRELVELIAADYPFAIGARLLSRDPHPRHQPRGRPRTSGREGRRRRRLPDHPAVLRQRPLLRLRRTRPRRRGDACRSSRASCRSRRSGRSSGWPRCAARAIPGGLQPRAARPRRGPGGGARLRRRLRDAAVRRAARRGRARDPLLHAQPIAGHARDRQRAEARQALGAGRLPGLDLESLGHPRRAVGAPRSARPPSRSGGRCRRPRRRAASASR